MQTKTNINAEIVVDSTNPQEIMFYKGNIHAHIHHENKLPTLKFKSNYKDRPEIIQTGENNKYYCVDAHLINYTPLTIDELYGK